MTSDDVNWLKLRHSRNWLSWLMNDPFEITKGDSGTPFQFQIGDQTGPLDLTGAHIVFLTFTLRGTLTKVMSPFPDQDQTQNRGWCRAFYSLPELDLVQPGNYPSHAMVTQNNTVRYFPPTPSVVLKIISPAGIDEGQPVPP